MKPKYWILILVSIAAISMALIYYVRQPVADVGPVTVHHTVKSANTSVFPSPIPEDMSGWKTYSNSEFGFSFDYPSSWGDIKIQQGNRSTLTPKDCEEYGGDLPTFDPMFLTYDESISFSSAPIEASFSISQAGTDNPYLSICGEKENFLDEARQYTPGQVNFSLGDVTAGFYDTNMQWNSNKFFGNAKKQGSVLAVEAYANYEPSYGTPEEIELRKFECQPKQSLNCGIQQWFNKGETSQKVRDGFSVFSQIINSFKFTN